MRIDLKQMRGFIKTRSGNLLFVLSSIIFASTICLAFLSVFLSGMGTDKQVVAEKGHELVVKDKPKTSQSEAYTSSQKEVKVSKLPKQVEQSTTPSAQDPASSSESTRNILPATPPASTMQNTSTVQSSEVPSTTVKVNQEEGNQVKGQLNQEEENQKEAERLKAEYEAKGYQVNIIYQGE